MDNIIVWVSNALSLGESISSIHNELASHGMSEDNIYLMIAAGKYLAEKRQELIKNKKNPFGRR